MMCPRLNLLAVAVLMLGCPAVLPPVTTPVDWTGPRILEDQPDDAVDEYQVHVLYVVPGDTTAAASSDTDGTIRRSVAAFSEWFSTRSGGLRLRFDTHQGRLDLTYVRLDAQFTELALAEGTVGTPRGPDFLRERLENILQVTFHAPRKLYLVYWDGLAFGRCGGAPYPPALPGRFTMLALGGVFQSSFLTARVESGSTTAGIHPLQPLALPPTPFAARLGVEDVTVTQVVDGAVTLAAPLLSSHADGELLRANEILIPDCRSSPFSADGRALGYWEFSGAHELMHPLGIVPGDAPETAAAPVAPGHLSLHSAAGTADLMYQGTENWDCIQWPRPPGPDEARCQLDPGHKNYFHAPGISVDLANSAFLDPTPAAAAPPPGW